MARTKAQWIAVIEPWITAASYSVSAFAEWLGLQDLVIGMAMKLETIVELFKSDVDLALATKQQFLLPWYVEKIKEFQYGDTLTVDANFIVGYNPVDETHRLITQVSARENEDTGVLTFKLAKTVSAVHVQLTTPELDAAKVYISQRKAPGTKTSVSSLPANSLRYTMTGSFNPMYPQLTIQAALDAAFAAYSASFTGDRFNGIVYESELIDALNDIPGFVLNTWILEWDDGTGFVPFTNQLELPAGYFNWDGGSTITLTSL